MVVVVSGNGVVFVVIGVVVGGVYSCISCVSFCCSAVSAVSGN